MCQCLICDCWWYNYCGVCCAGWHWAYLLCSCWICKPVDLQVLDPRCCHACECDGCGGNFFCQGSVCCAPKWVVEWSRLRSLGSSALALNTGNTVIINTPTHQIYDPNIYTANNTQLAMGISPNANYGMNANVNMGMNANMNMGMNQNVRVNSNLGMPGNSNSMGMNVNGNQMVMQVNTNGLGNGVNITNTVEMGAKNY